MNLDNIRDSIWRPVQILVRGSALSSVENVVHRPVLRSVLFSVRDYISNNVVLVWWNSTIRKQYESN